MRKQICILIILIVVWSVLDGKSLSWDLRVGVVVFILSLLSFLLSGGLLYFLFSLG